MNAHQIALIVGADSQISMYTQNAGLSVPLSGVFDDLF